MSLYVSFSHKTARKDERFQSNHSQSVAGHFFHTDDVSRCRLWIESAFLRYHCQRLPPSLSVMHTKPRSTCVGTVAQEKDKLCEGLELKPHAKSLKNRKLESHGTYLILISSKTPGRDVLRVVEKNQILAIAGGIDNMRHSPIPGTCLPHPQPPASSPNSPI